MGAGPSIINSMITVEKEQIVAAFTEWERMYRESPQEFMNEVERLSIDPQNYGENVTPFFLKLLGV